MVPTFQSIFPAESDNVNADAELEMKHRQHLARNADQDGHGDRAYWETQTEEWLVTSANPDRMTTYFSPI